VAKLDAEVLALARIQRCLAGLDEAQARRVLEYFRDRYGVPALAPRDGCRAVPLAPVRVENHSGKAQGE
jgi:hypothetical protein